MLTDLDLENTASSSTCADLPSELLSEPYCLTCGSAMMEVDRRQENGLVTCWFECIDAQCNQQRLEHIPSW